LIVKFSTEDMQELLRLVRSISNNVNQIAVRVNSTDKVYVEDMNNIKDGVEKIWQQLRYFQSQLRSVKQ
ncbi:plasmid mobilization relaxosome protein MobC, partial [Ruminococcus sp.]